MADVTVIDVPGMGRQLTCAGDMIVRVAPLSTASCLSANRVPIQPPCTLLGRQGLCTGTACFFP